MKNNKNILEKPVDVICYGNKRHFNTRKEAIKYFLDYMSCSEGAECQRYTRIYLELTNSSKSVVSDGEPEIKKEKTVKSYTVEDKEEILDLIAKKKLSVNSSEIYDIGTCRLKIEDREIIKALLDFQGWYAAQFLRKYIADDKELIKAACVGGDRIYPTLQYASETLCDDKEFVLQMINLSCRNIQYASERLRNDIDVVTMALYRMSKDDKYDTNIVKSNIGTNLLLSLVNSSAA